MQKLTLALLFTMFTSLGFAQTFDLTTNFVQFSGSFSSSIIQSPYWLPTIHNLSNDTIELRWVRVEKNYTNNWRTSFCREMYCYSMADDSGTWQLLPGDSDMLYCDLYPYGYADTGNVVVKIFDVNNPSDSVRVMYRCDALTSIEEHQGYEFLSTDNTTHRLSVTMMNSGVLQVSDNLGRNTSTTRITGGLNYIFQMKEAGVYYLTFTDESGKVFTRKVLL